MTSFDGDVIIQAESYLKQRKYKAAENMYKQILQSASKQQDHHSAPAPPTSGEPANASTICDHPSCICIQTYITCFFSEPRRRLSSWTPEREMAPKVRYIILYPVLYSYV